MTAYYNEHDPNAAQWLRELIKLDQIAPGEVDERSIVDVDPNELKSFSQIHLFAGIGVWSYALRQAGWSDDREIVSGSCPCQSFSSAGKQRGFDDERHLWPHMFRIVAELRPSICIGEQVASAGALAWWDLVASDLESADYAATAIDLSGASIGAPHIRQRLFWVAHTNSCRNKQNPKWDRETNPAPEELSSRLPVRTSSTSSKLGNASQSQCQEQRNPVMLPATQLRFTNSSIPNCMADTSSTKRGSIQHRSDIFDGEDDRREKASPEFDDGDKINELAHTNSDVSIWDIPTSSREGDESTRQDSTTQNNGSISTFWDDAIWLPCRDGKYRATKSGISPLAPRSTAGMGHSSDPSVESIENTQEARIMRLKGYGNAIVAPLAVEFISAYLDCKS